MKMILLILVCCCFTVRYMFDCMLNITLESILIYWQSAQFWWFFMGKKRYCVVLVYVNIFGEYMAYFIDQFSVLFVCCRRAYGRFSWGHYQRENSPRHENSRTGRSTPQTDLLQYGQGGTTGVWRTYKIMHILFTRMDPFGI